MSKKVVAVSGGVDSSVLLTHMVETYGKEDILAVYIDHGTPQSKDMLQTVQELTEMLQVELKVKTIQDNPQRVSDLGKEGYWREERYRLLLEETDSELYTGHHIWDNTETMLMKIIRGTGVNGLTGIAREVIIDSKTVIRPLINMQKSELYVQAAAKQLPYIEDKSNSDISYNRNFIRSILSNLRERYPHVDDLFLRLSENAKEYSDMAEDLFWIDYKKMVIASPSLIDKDKTNSFFIDKPLFMELGKHRRANLIKKLTEHFSETLSRNNIDTVLNLTTLSQTFEKKRFETKKIKIETNKAEIRISAK